MLFLLLVHSAPDGEELDDPRGATEAWVSDVESAGARIVGERLVPSDEAMTLTIRGGEEFVVSGPADGRDDTIVGFDVLECASLDEALDAIMTHPMAVMGRLEIRAGMPFD
ncbi:YciI family protein [Glaciihabitans sp. dw_435]|uniref:YciI family protein n=1 Tax=Glaciihabitans sp. dw_435 TaxID=2720081 RepID=UPI001BD564ED|nr:YciI family protein [Glaciihabitans sp. dw_435]